MNYVELIIGMKNRYKNKDEEIVNEINCCICKYLSKNNKGNCL